MLTLTLTHLFHPPAGGSDGGRKEDGRPPRQRQEPLGPARTSSQLTGSAPPATFVPRSTSVPTFILAAAEAETDGSGSPAQRSRPLSQPPFGKFSQNRL